MKKTFEIEASQEVMERFERFIALLHYSSCFGHSGLFAMPLDGDGSEKVVITPRPRFRHEVDLCAGVGFDVEIAQSGCYSGKRLSDMGSSWVIKSTASLYKNGDMYKTIPSSGRKSNEPLRSRMPAHSQSDRLHRKAPVGEENG